MNKASIKSRFSPVFRGIALSLVLSFAANDLLHAAPLTPISFNLAHNPSKISFPQSVAHVSETYKGSSGKILIHIQDAHTNLSAQQNLSRVLEELMRQHKVKTLFVEGSSKDVTLSFLRPLASQAVRERIAKQYLMRAELNGAEYLNLSSDHDMRILGVEDKALYQRNLKTYAGIVDKRESILSYIGEIQKRIESLKRRFYTKDLVAFDDFLGKYEKKEKDFTEYYTLLSEYSRKYGVNLLGFAHFLSLKDLKSKEEVIDFSKANEEQTMLLQELFKGEDSEELKKLTEAFGKIKNQTYAPVDFYETLLNKAQAAKIEPVRYENLLRYVEYLKLYAAVDMARLLDDTKRIEESVYQNALEDSDAKYLHEIDSHLKSLYQLFSLQISKENYFAYEERMKDVRFETIVFLAFLNKKIYDLGNFSEVLRYLSILDENRKEVEDFYTTTEKRDEVFVRKALKKMAEDKLDAAVLLSGGYHTSNLKTLLKKENISYVVVTPHIEHETNIKRYEEILLSQLDETNTKTVQYASNQENTHTIAVPYIVDKPTNLTDLKKDLVAAGRSSKLEFLPMVAKTSIVDDWVKTYEAFVSWIRNTWFRVLYSKPKSLDALLSDRTINDYSIERSESFRLGLINGVHSRPARRLVDAANQFDSRVWIVAPNGAEADARDFIHVLSLGLALGDSIEILAEGPDSLAAVAAFKTLLEREYLGDEEAPGQFPEASTSETGARLASVEESREQKGWEQFITEEIHKASDKFAEYPETLKNLLNFALPQILKILSEAKDDNHRNSLVGAFIRLVIHEDFPMDARWDLVNWAGLTQAVLDHVPEGKSFGIHYVPHTQGLPYRGPLRGGGVPDMTQHAGKFNTPPEYSEQRQKLAIIPPDSNGARLVERHPKGILRLWTRIGAAILVGLGFGYVAKAYNDYPHQTVLLEPLVALAVAPTIIAISVGLTLLIKKFDKGPSQTSEAAKERIPVGKGLFRLWTRIGAAILVGLGFGYAAKVYDQYFNPLQSAQIESQIQKPSGARLAVSQRSFASVFFQRIAAAVEFISENLAQGRIDLARQMLEPLERDFPGTPEVVSLRRLVNAHKPAAQVKQRFDRYIEALKDHELAYLLLRDAIGADHADLLEYERSIPGVVSARSEFVSFFISNQTDQSVIRENILKFLEQNPNPLFTKQEEWLVMENLAEQFEKSSSGARLSVESKEELLLLLNGALRFAETENRFVSAFQSALRKAQDMSEEKFGLYVSNPQNLWEYLFSSELGINKEVVPFLLTLGAVSTTVVQDYEEMSQRAANLIRETIAEKEDSVLLLPTGNTPKRMYSLLVEMAKRNEIDFSKVTIFMLDEYRNGNDYHDFIAKNFIDQLPANNRPKEVRVLNGFALDPDAEAVSYEAHIKDLGGVDLAVLGIGVEGHIGFNERGSERDSRARVITLAPSTIAANREAAENNYTQALSAGVGTILDARRIILLISGPSKAPVVRDFFATPPSKNLPATWLKTHQHVTMIVDKAAATDALRTDFGARLAQSAPSNLEVLNPIENIQIRAAALDWDGTISRLREGWEGIMVPLVASIISGTVLRDEEWEEILDSIKKNEEFDSEYMNPSMRKLIADGRISEEDMKWAVEMVEDTKGMPTKLQYQKAYDEAAARDLSDSVRNDRRGNIKKWMSEYASQSSKPFGDDTALGLTYFYQNALLEKIIQYRFELLEKGEIKVEDLLVSGGIEFIQMLIARGVKVSIITGSNTDTVANEIAKLGLAGLEVVGQDPARGIMDKESVMRDLQQRTGLAGNELLVIGDGKVEIEAGVKLGWVTIAIKSRDNARNIHRILELQPNYLMKEADYSPIKDLVRFLTFPEFYRLTDYSDTTGLLEGIYGDILGSATPRKIMIRASAVESYLEVTGFSKTRDPQESFRAVLRDRINKGEVRLERMTVKDASANSHVRVRFNEVVVINGVSISSVVLATTTGNTFSTKVLEAIEKEGSLPEPARAPLTSLSYVLAKEIPDMPYEWVLSNDSQVAIFAERIGRDGGERDQIISRVISERPTPKPTLAVVKEAPKRAPPQTLQAPVVSTPKSSFLSWRLAAYVAAILFVSWLPIYYTIYIAPRSSANAFLKERPWANFEAKPTMENFFEAVQMAQDWLAANGYDDAGVLDILSRAGLEATTEYGKASNSANFLIQNQHGIFINLKNYEKTMKDIRTGARDITSTKEWNQKFVRYLLFVANDLRRESNFNQEIAQSRASQNEEAIKLLSEMDAELLTVLDKDRMSRMADLRDKYQDRIRRLMASMTRDQYLIEQDKGAFTVWTQSLGVLTTVPMEYDTDPVFNAVLNYVGKVNNVDEIERRIGFARLNPELNSEPQLEAEDIILYLYSMLLVDIHADDSSATMRDVVRRDVSIMRPLLDQAVVSVYGSSAGARLAELDSTQQTVLWIVGPGIFVIGAVIAFVERERLADMAHFIFSFISAPEKKKAMLSVRQPKPSEDELLHTATVGFVELTRTDSTVFAKLLKAHPNKVVEGLSAGLFNELTNLGIIDEEGRLTKTGRAIANPKSGARLAHDDFLGNLAWRLFGLVVNIGNHTKIDAFQAPQPLSREDMDAVRQILKNQPESILGIIVSLGQPAEELTKPKYMIVDGSEGSEFQVSKTVLELHEQLTKTELFSSGLVGALKLFSRQTSLFIINLVPLKNMQLRKYSSKDAGIDRKQPLFAHWIVIGRDESADRRLETIIKKEISRQTGRGARLSLDADSNASKVSMGDDFNTFVEKFRRGEVRPGDQIEFRTSDGYKVKATLEMLLFHKLSNGALYAGTVYYISSSRVKSQPAHEIMSIQKIGSAKKDLMGAIYRLFGLSVTDRQFEDDLLMVLKDSNFLAEQAATKSGKVFIQDKIQEILTRVDNQVRNGVSFVNKNMQEKWAASQDLKPDTADRQLLGQALNKASEILKTEEQNFKVAYNFPKFLEKILQVRYEVMTGRITRQKGREKIQESLDQNDEEDSFLLDKTALFTRKVALSRINALIRSIFSLIEKFEVIDKESIQKLAADIDREEKRFSKPKQDDASSNTILVDGSEVRSSVLAAIRSQIIQVLNTASYGEHRIMAIRLLREKADLAIEHDKYSLLFVDGNPIDGSILKILNDHGLLGAQGVYHPEVAKIVKNMVKISDDGRIALTEPVKPAAGARLSTWFKRRPSGVSEQVIREKLALNIRKIIGNKSISTIPPNEVFEVTIYRITDQILAKLRSEIDLAREQRVNGSGSSAAFESLIDVMNQAYAGLEQYLNQKVKLREAILNVANEAKSGALDEAQMIEAFHRILLNEGFADQKSFYVRDYFNKTLDLVKRVAIIIKQFAPNTNVTQDDLNVLVKEIDDIFHPKVVLTNGAIVPQEAVDWNMGAFRWLGQNRHTQALGELWLKAGKPAHTFSEDAKKVLVYVRLVRDTDGELAPYTRDILLAAFKPVDRKMTLVDPVNHDAASQTATPKNLEPLTPSVQALVDYVATIKAIFGNKTDSTKDPRDTAREEIEKKINAVFGAWIPKKQGTNNLVIHVKWTSDTLPHGYKKEITRHTALPNKPVMVDVVVNLEQLSVEANMAGFGKFLSEIFSVDFEPPAGARLSAAEKVARIQEWFKANLNNGNLLTNIESATYSLNLSRALIGGEEHVKINSGWNGASFAASITVDEEFDLIDLAVSVGEFFRSTHSLEVATSWDAFIMSLEGESFDDGARLSSLGSTLDHFKLNPFQLKAIAQRFASDIAAAGTGLSSLSRIATAYPAPTEPREGTYLFVDLGGTNLRVGSVSLKKEGKKNTATVLSQNSFEVPLEYVRGGGVALFKFIASKIDQEILSQNLSGQKIKLGFTFSFPFERRGVDHGIITPASDNKGFKFHQLYGKDVAGVLQEELNQLGLGKVHVAALVNDTEGTRDAGIFLNPDTIAGAIFGTGHNIAIRKGILSINLESGGFSGINTNDIDLQLDAQTDNPGKYLMEKAMSGRYLGPIVGMTLHRLVDKKAFLKGQEVPVFFTDHNLGSDSYQGIHTEDLSQIASLDDSSLKEFLQTKGVANVEDEDLKIIRMVSDVIVTRSTYLGAAAFAGIIMEHEQGDIKDRYAFALNGSLLKYPGYVDKIKEGLRLILGDKKAGTVDIFEAPDGSGVGAAIVAAYVDAEGARLASSEDLKLLSDSIEENSFRDLSTADMLLRPDTRNEALQQIATTIARSLASSIKEETLIPFTHGNLPEPVIFKIVPQNGGAEISVLKVQDIDKFATSQEIVLTLVPVFSLTASELKARPVVQEAGIKLTTESLSASYAYQASLEEDAFNAHILIPQFIQEEPVLKLLPAYQGRGRNDFNAIFRNIQQVVGTSPGAVQAILLPYTDKTVDLASTIKVVNELAKARGLNFIIYFTSRNAQISEEVREMLHSLETPNVQIGALTLNASQMLLPTALEDLRQRNIQTDKLGQMIVGADMADILSSSNQDLLGYIEAKKSLENRLHLFGVSIPAAQGVVSYADMITVGLNTVFENMGIRSGINIRFNRVRTAFGFEIWVVEAIIDKALEQVMVSRQATAQAA